MSRVIATNQSPQRGWRPKHLLDRVAAALVDRVDPQTRDRRTRHARRRRASEAVTAGEMRRLSRHSPESTQDQ